MPLGFCGVCGVLWVLVTPAPGWEELTSNQNFIKTNTWNFLRFKILFDFSWFFTFSCLANFLYKVCNRFYTCGTYLGKCLILTHSNGYYKFLFHPMKISSKVQIEKERKARKFQAKEISGRKLINISLFWWLPKKSNLRTYFYPSELILKKILPWLTLYL